MDELLDYEMDEDDDDDEELDNEILQLDHENGISNFGNCLDSNVVENVPKIELKELTLFQNTVPMDLNEDPSSNEQKQKSENPTSSIVSSEKSESVEQVTSLLSSNFDVSNEIWQKYYSTMTKVMNHVAPTQTTELAQAEKVEESSSICATELSKIPDDVSSLTNDLEAIRIHPLDLNVNEQKPPQDAIQHTTSMRVALNKQKSPPYESPNTNLNKQMSPKYENLHTTCIPMKINKQKPLQNGSTTILSSGENSKTTASKWKLSTNSQDLAVGIERIEPRRDQNYETVFHTKRNVPRLTSIKVLPPIESEGQTRPATNNSDHSSKIASPFIITALNGAQSVRKVLINPSFKGFGVKDASDANYVPIKRREEGMKRNITHDDLRSRMRKKHKPISYEPNHSEVRQANGNADGMDSESDELKQYRMEMEKMKLAREEFQRKKELRCQQVGVDAYNEDLCRI